ncbi:hypothetical protein NHX12_018376 [Muraenolepis orangiensis]|uniref:FAM193 C-terminal domain-containing protein n=1 Tax=Muraenolepis orangiensis TaxID=630683 RepID=A0A9Q0EZH7_9TELE|nr:hypothetical protein NHX12_018376 [Muraenolepis orangiensis]
MSPTDAKRGAKRRKNKRGGGGSSSAVCSGKAGVVSALCAQGTTTPVPAVSFLTSDSGGNGSIASVAGLNGEVPTGNSLTPQFTEGPVNADFSGVLQTPFTFGLNHQAPYTSGDRCLLCRCERKESVLQSEMEGCGQNGTDQPSNNPSTLQLPLWVCPDCRHTGAKEDQQTIVEQSLGSQDFLLHVPVGNGGPVLEPAPGDSMTAAVSTLPMLPAPDLATPMTPDGVCSCEACKERREISAETERESQQLQNHWSEVRYLVRCIYRQTRTPLMKDRDQPLDRDKAGMKKLVDRLCEKDPYQLYQRLEQQAREYVLEMKQGPAQAHYFVSLLLEEYNALCQAARTISGFLLTLENEHLQKFRVTWELHNKHLFENLVFSEPTLHGSLPTLLAQLKRGFATHDVYTEDVFGTLLDNFLQLQEEMAAVAAKWQECERRIDDYVDEQVEGQNLTDQQTEPHKSLISKNILKTKQQMLKEEWEFFKQRRFIEEQLTNNKKYTAGDNFEDAMKMLASRLSILGCPNCNYRRRCTCDDCSLSHILTCGIMDSPMAEDLHVKLPMHEEQPRDYLAEGDTHIFISDEDEGPTKFGDVYAMSAFEDHSGATGSALGLHSPRGLSSSSSEGEEEEADQEISQPPGQQGDQPSGMGNSPPPSYNHQLPQVEQVQHPCQCHACSQEPAFGHPAFFADNKAPSPHTALHLYPHIHGHLPLRNMSCLPRPLIYPTHYPPNFRDGSCLGSVIIQNYDSEPLPPAPSPNHCAAKQQSFSPSLSEHVYQNCFSAQGAGAGDWNSSLQCLSLKFENLWDAAVMKSLNTSMLLPDAIPDDILGPHLPDVALPQPTYIDAHQDCLSLDVFLESKRMAKATSGSTASVSCTTTTVQSSNNSDLHLASKRPSSLDDGFHTLGKDDHRLQTSPVAPRSSPTGLASLPPLSGPTLPPAPGAHLPTLGSKPFPKMAALPPGFLESRRQGLALLPAELPAPSAAPSMEGPISTTPSSVCSDPDCAGHRCERKGAYKHQPYDGAESQDEDSCSEHSSSTSTSTNQKEGKYCDCCYCEFFGHGGPPAAPTSRNYAEMREKLRLRLTKRKEEQPKREEQQPGVLERDGGVEDHRRVEDLLQFINSADNKPTTSSKAAKRARHKQKKLEEKARQEAEAQLQHLCAAKKKRREPAKENKAPPHNSPQPLKQTAQNVLENLHNSDSQLQHNLSCLPDHKEPRFSAMPPLPPPPPLLHKRHIPKSHREKAPPTDSSPAPGTMPSLLNGTSPTSHPEPHGKARVGPASRTSCCEAAVRKTRGCELASAGQPIRAGAAERQAPYPRVATAQGSIDDVFLPKDIDLDSTEMDETEREVECFKRFCLDSARQTRQRLSINWSNFSLKKATFVAHLGCL